MPSLKRNVADAPETTGFESYDGPNLPTQNKMYRGRVEVARVREASTGTVGFNLLVRFVAEKGSEDSKYDGFPAWVDIWLADKEPNQAREAAFYRAIGVPEKVIKSGEVNVVHKDIDDGGEITKISGRKPLGAIVKVDMRTDQYGGETRMKGDAVWPVKKAAESADESGDDYEDPDADLLEDAADPDGGEREAELEEMGLPALRREAKSLGIDTKGLKKDDLVSAILEAEDLPEDDPEPEADEGPDRAEELGEMSLPALRKIAKGLDISTKGLDAEDLAEAIMEAEQDELGEPDDGDAYATIAALSLPKLRTWAVENADYKASDLKGVSKEDILEMLVDDEVLEEPPF